MSFDPQLLYEVSRHYYELGRTQEEIAQSLGISRSQVSRAIKKARDEGIVVIKLVPPAGSFRRAAPRDDGNLRPVRLRDRGRRGGADEDAHAEPGDGRSRYPCPPPRPPRRRRHPGGVVGRHPA